MLPVQLEHCHKPSETRRRLRRHSEEKIPFVRIRRSNFTNLADPKLYKIFLMFLYLSSRM